MSYSANQRRAWNTSQLNRVEANIPPIFSGHDNSHPAQWNNSEVNLQPSLSRRVSPNADSQPNVFSTGSLVEALAEPPSASRNSPARPIKQRKGTHKRQSSSGSRHPSSPSRQEEAARAAAVAAMHQAFSVQQGPFRRTPSLETPRASARMPLAAARQPADVSPPVRIQPEQERVIPHGQPAHRERRRVAAMYPMLHIQGQSRGIYQTAQPTRYAGPIESHARNPGTYSDDF